MQETSESRRNGEFAARIDRAIEARTRTALLNRRELFRRTGLLLLTAGVTPTLLAACGGGSSSAENVTTASTETGGAATTAGAPGELGGTLDYLSWEGYDLPDIMTPWLNANGVTLNPTYIGDHNEIQTKLIASGGDAGYDIITYYQGYAEYYSALEILSPLDEERIPNLANLFPVFATDIGNYWVRPDGTRTGVPWTWGITSLIYDSAVISEPPTTFEALLDPQYKGQVGIANDPIGGVQLAAQSLGFDYTAIPKADVPRLEEFLKQLFGQAKTVSPTFGDATSLIVAGDTSFIYPGWAAVQSFAADAGKDTVRLTVPTDGGAQLSTDAWAIPPGADNLDAAYGWINETLVPKIQAQAAEYLVAGVVVEDAVPLLDPATAQIFPYDTIEETVSSQLAGLPPQESDEFLTFKESVTLWTTAAASAGS